MLLAGILEIILPESDNGSSTASVEWYEKSLGGTQRVNSIGEGAESNEYVACALNILRPSSNEIAEQAAAIEKELVMQWMKL